MARRFDGLEDRMDKVEFRLNSIEATQSEHTKKFTEISARLDIINEKVTKTETNISGLDGDVNHLTN